MTKRELNQLLASRLAKAGLHLECLDNAREVVIFGSYAVGANSRGSDLDVLAVGSTTRVKHCGLDLVSLSYADVQSQGWLGSELASHVAIYGIWVRGYGEWKTLAVLSENSKIAKTRRIERLLRAVVKGWDDLHPAFQSRYRRNIRREFQRLHLLQQLIPIPPTAILDRLWQADRPLQMDIVDIVSDLRMDSNCCDFAYREVFQLVRARGF